MRGVSKVRQTDVRAARSFIVTAALSLAFVAGLTPADAQVRMSQDGKVVSFTGSRAPSVDYANATALNLPMRRTAPPSFAQGILNGRSPAFLFGTAGFSPGAVGTGWRSPVALPMPRHGQLQRAPSDQKAPSDMGTSNHPYTTAQVNASGDLTIIAYPFRAAGKLFFTKNGSSFICSASLIKRGLVVTAAHCVANFGQSQFYTNFSFVPAYHNGAAPYGTVTPSNVYVLTAYYNGTDSCAVSGVVCQDDVAVMTLNPFHVGVYLGDSTGYFGYGWNGYSYNPSGQAMISQLGYPASLDSGAIMERTDSQGFTSPGDSNNTVIGSAMTGGSSGGPWLVNLGISPSGIVQGSAPNRNVVVGTTSWGYTDNTVQQQGASPFTTNNIVTLVNQACGATPAAC